MFHVPWDNLKLTSTPAAVLTTSEAKAQLRATHTSEDSLIDAYVRAATADIEDMMGMAFTSGTWTAYLDEFPDDDTIVIPRAPLASVALISYRDSAGSLQTVSSGDYHVVAGERPGRIVLAAGKSWPSTRDPWGDVQIVVTLGFGDASVVPEICKQAIRLRLTRYFENREDHQQNLDHAVAAIVRNHGTRRAA